MISKPLLPSLLLAAFSLSACREKQTLFDTLDTNHDQKLSRSELENAVADGLFKSYDANHDGLITTAEWRKRDPDGDGSFLKQRDGNRDGTITRAEALASIHRRGFCQDIIQQSDRNHDGTLELAEAKVWISDHPEILERLRIGD